jgi:adenylate kinase family enzyme
VIAPNKDPQAKLLKRLSASLAQHNAVVLKGPPGSGKTYLSLEYAKNKGIKPFWGEKGIEDWLSHTPPEGKEAVLVLDEANLSVPGTWDALIHDPRRTKQHKIIFTCNPEDYPGRTYHDILQDTPTLYVKSWTDEGLLKHILLPMCQESKIYHDKTHKPVLMNLLASYRLAMKLMPKDTLSIRDLQQVTFRWLKSLEAGSPPQESAYIAAWHEWAESFFDIKQAENFKIKLAAIFKLKLEMKPDPMLLDEGVYLSRSRQWMLSQIAADMKLSSLAASSVTADAAPLAKSGVVVEGPSGVGKSTIMEQFLKNQKIERIEVSELLKLSQVSETKSESKINNLSQRYIHFTVTGNFVEDGKILLAAFHSGCKVILDELNLDTTLETFLNHLLTGRTPKGELSTYQGFFVLASQNSAGFEGTKTVSKALMNRLHVLYAKEDTRNDLLEMASQAFPKQSKAYWENMVDAYLEQKAKYPKEVNARTFFNGMSEIKKIIFEAPSVKRSSLSIGLSNLNEPVETKPIVNSPASTPRKPNS